MLIDRLHLPDLERDTSEGGDREAATILLVATVLLVVFFYWGRPGFYTSSGLIDWVDGRAIPTLTEHPGVGAYLWWGLSSIVIRVLVPLGVIIFLLKRKPVDFGFRIRGVGRHFAPYAAMYLLMLPVLLWASSLSSFRGYYPFYDRAAEGGAAFWLFELGYLVQFVGVEAFFRGFLTFGLARRFGLLSVVIMTVPYTMIHFNKPMPEAFAAIFAGLILGYMALRSRSFVPGIALHVGVAFTMDILVLSRSGSFGNLL